MSLFWGASTSKFDEDVDRATAETLPSGAENIELNFEISDAIRSKTIPPKDAMRTIKRRINHNNPNVQLLALGLADTCVKNGGDHFLAEIASREFLDNLVSIIKVPAVNLDVKTKILRLIQNWAMVFESKPALSYSGEVYKLLQKEGFNFPPKDIVATSAAMIDSMTPPEWIDSDVCLRCRTPFSFTNRKHHCRSCGLVFDQQCSSKVLPLPALGIDQPVRVCDGCFVKVGGKSKTGPTVNGKGIEYLHQHHHRTASSSKASTSANATANGSAAKKKSARELADEDLQRAIQMSLEDAGMVHGPRRADFVPPETPRYEVSEPPLVDRSGAAGEEEDEELRAAIEASLREANAPRPSAPVGLDEPEERYGQQQQQQPHQQAYEPAQPYIQPLPNYDLSDTESDAIMTFSQAVEVAQQRGAISPEFVQHREVGDLYERTGGYKPKLARSLDDAGRREQILSEMNQKLSQAARLYDQLLTAQVSSPIRLQSPSLPQTHSQPYAQYYTPPPQQEAYYTPPPQQQQQQPQGYEYAQSPMSYAPPQPQHPYEQYAHAPTPAPEQYDAASSSAAYAQPSQLASAPVSIQPQYYQPAQPAAIASPPPPPPPTHQHQPQRTTTIPAQQYEYQPAQAASPPPQQYTPHHAQTLPPQQLQYQQPQPQQLQQPQQPQQQQQQYPAFPSVPTDLPPIPTPQVVEPPQPKEAMLISFD